MLLIWFWLVVVFDTQWTTYRISKSDIDNVVIYHLLWTLKLPVSIEQIPTLLYHSLFTTQSDFITSQNKGHDTTNFKPV